MEDNIFNDSMNKGNTKEPSEELHKINYEALSIYKSATEENPETEIKDIVVCEETTLQRGDMQYPHYPGTIYPVTRTENINGEEIEVIDFYKSLYDPKTEEFKPIKMAIKDEKGLRLTDEYKQLLENQYRYSLQEKGELDFVNMIEDISIENLGLVLKEPPLDLIDRKELIAELNFLSLAEIEEKYQLQMWEAENLDELDFKKNIKDLPENDEEELEQLAIQNGLDTASIQAITKISPKEIVASGITFESAMHIEGKYSSCCAACVNGKFGFYGRSIETGKMELIQNNSNTTLGERNIPIMEETGNIEKKQVRAIFKVDKTQAFAINIEPGSGTMKVSYLARGAGENEYFGKRIGTDNQTTATGEVQRFMGVEVMGKTDNRRETVEEAYEQLDEVDNTNKTLIDENESNDEIYGYFDVNEPIKMHDGSETTIAKEAESSEKYKNNLQEYITELEDAQGKCLSEKIESMREKMLEEDEHDRGDKGDELEARRLEELRRQEQYRAKAEADSKKW